MPAQITIRGARLHNLKNINLTIPKDQLVVLTGVSGSGKSTLGFDILLKEGQRQFLEALGMAPYGLAKAPLDAISGLSPTVSIDQHHSNHSPRSTVGTTSYVYTYLRVLFAQLGRRPCPACGVEIPPAAGISTSSWPAEPDAEDEEAPQKTIACPHCGAPVPILVMAHFSFNKPAGACPTCSGLGTVRTPDLNRLVDQTKSLAGGAVSGWEPVLIQYHSGTLLAAASHYGFDFDLSLPVKDYTQTQRDLLLHGVESPLFQRHFPGLKPPTTVRGGRFEGVATSLLRRSAEHTLAHQQDDGYRDKLDDFLLTQTCPDCAGTRLRPESRAVTVCGQDMTSLVRLPLTELAAWLKRLPSLLSSSELPLASPVLASLDENLQRLMEVGAGYLSLERSSASLSAGETQRLRLASVLGSSLSGVLYVCDEPTIGLHPRDTHRLIDLLRRLRDLGNSVLVIEHNTKMIIAADHVIDFGPGAGKYGGRVVATGSPAEIAAQPDSLTGAYLAGRLSIPLPEQRRPPGEKAITIHGARQHNLQNIDVRIPLGLLVAVTGVSGSGKSSLIFDILAPALRLHLSGSGEAPGAHDSLEGLEHIQRLVTIDQDPIGRVPRSNAATYSEAFGPMREAFAGSAEARQQGLSARHFSFNQPGGRCERCQGAGVLTVRMQLLPDVEVRCPECGGRRFNADTLAVHYRDHDISQVLDLTIDEALELFESVPAARSRLQALSDVGLGYLQLGQPATTLSGGEAQRVKLAKELGRRGAGRTLYLLDEPTTGLHLHDTARLLGVLQRLVQNGDSVIVIEHNLELVKTADWVIDLGPQGGGQGGRLVAAGTPEQVAGNPASITGQYLKEIPGIFNS